MKQYAAGELGGFIPGNSRLLGRSYLYAIALERARWATFGPTNGPMVGRLSSNADYQPDEREAQMVDRAFA